MRASWSTSRRPPRPRATRARAADPAATLRTHRLSARSAAPAPRRAPRDRAPFSPASSVVGGVLAARRGHRGGARSRSTRLERCANRDAAQQPIAAGKRTSTRAHRAYGRHRRDHRAGAPSRRGSPPGTSSARRRARSSSRRAASRGGSDGRRDCRRSGGPSSGRSSSALCSSRATRRRAGIARPARGDRDADDGRPARRARRRGPRRSRRST